MNVREKNRIRLRIKFVALLFLMCLGTILSRAYYLQILKKDHLDAIARNGYVGTTKLPAKRGTIYDRKGRELALSVEVKSVYAHPKQVKEKAKAVRHLARVLGQRQSAVLKRLNSKQPFVWIARKIPPKRARMVEDANIAGVAVTDEIRRFYPGKESGAHLIGFVGADNQGLEGLEKKFDSFLKGSQERLIQMRDALGRPFSISEPSNSGNGMCDLILTIDKDIQFKAQEALRYAVEKSKAKSGHCLVVNPGTGEILAMAVSPEFNPNVFSKFEPSHWRNRIITDCYEQGSTIKAFLLAACLEEQVMGTATMIDCENGKYKIGNRIVHDTKEHGVMSVSDIIMHSSNIGSVKMGWKIGYGTFFDYLEKFGFNNRIGIDLIGERKGFIRPIHDAKPIDQANLFFGQGMTATSLQLAMAMSAIANGGKLMRPYVVRAIVNESGRLVNETFPEVINRVISQNTARKVSRVLERVVSEEGTAEPASIGGFRVAGKTGTPQKVDPKTGRYSWRKYMAAFVGFVPVENPKFVILVVIDEPKGIHYGGLVAGPVFREVGQWSLNYLRVNPLIRANKIETHKSRKDEREKALTIAGGNAVKVQEGGLPDFKGLGMREALKKGNALGLRVIPDGTGLAVKQDPKPGTSLEKIRMVKVEFEPPR